MLIVFGNQKGGAGKTTLATLFANQLTLIKKREVIVLDMDYQKSLVSSYEKSKALENPELYEVIGADLEQFPALFEVLSSKENQDKIIIIDLPGKIDDDHLLPIMRNTDIFVVPFTYDEKTYEATMLFTLLAHHLKPDAKKFFIPNRIKANVKYTIKESCDTQLSEYGYVTDSISDRIDFQRVTTKDIPASLLDTLEKSFEPINKLI